MCGGGGAAGSSRSAEADLPTRRRGGDGVWERESFSEGLTLLFSQALR